MRASPASAIEWPTLFLIVATYVVWGLGTTVAASVFGPLGFLLTMLAIVQFSSLQHEVLHGHPFRRPLLNEALVFAGLTLFVPYRRFRDTHLQHHFDERLTDPYDDPESNYMDPAVWARLPGWLRGLLRANNTLLGRILLGPAVSTVAFVGADLRAIRAGDRTVAQAWLLHLAGLVPVALWLLLTPGMDFWTYAVAAYAAYGILKIRTFLEHRAHEKARGRTVIVEDRGPLALLFLNNNLHVVHHARPGVPWYRLPDLYRTRRAEWLRRNEGYLYRSYAEVFRRHLLTPKDPVPHPLWPPERATGHVPERLSETGSGAGVAGGGVALPPAAVVAGQIRDAVPASPS